MADPEFGTEGPVATVAPMAPQERRNIAWIATASLLSGAGATLYGGELWQGFLKATGFSLTEIGLLAAAPGLASSFGLIAFMGLADRLQQRVRTYVMCILLTVLAPLLTVGVAMAPRTAIPLSVFLGVLLVINVVQSLVLAIPVMLDYPIFARTVSPGARGRLFGVTTVCYGLLGIGLGWLSANVLKDVAYPTGYVWCFLAAAVAIALRAAAYSRIQELPELAVEGASRSVFPVAAIVDVLKLKEFQWLAGPHVLRGLAMGAIGMAVPVALGHLGLPKHYPGYASATTTAATVLGGLLVGLYADRLGAAWATLLGDAVYAGGMATVILLGGHPTVFLALYFVTQLGRSVEDNTVPLGAINLVPAAHLGAFSAARLMILTGSSAVGAPLFGYLLDHCNPALVFGLAALMKLLTGVWFYWAFKQPTPARAAVPTADG